MSARLDHVTVVTGDLATSAAFYDEALAALGLVRVVDLVDEEEEDAATEAIAYGGPEGPGVLWLVAGSPASRQLHLCFRAPDRAAVEAFHAAGVAAGGSSHDAPRRWPIFRTGEFNAIVTDPDGNLVEAVSDE